jgi:predicted P-loop ATPase
MITNEINSIVVQIENNKIDITNNYKDWLKIGLAIADALAENGSTYFHSISKFSDKYDYAECEKHYNYCLNSKNSGVTIKTFFYFAKENGIDTSSVKSFSLADYKLLKKENRDKHAHKKDNTIIINKIEDYLISNDYSFRYNEVTTRSEVKMPCEIEFLPLTDYIENSILRDVLKADLKCNLTLLHSIIESDFSSKYNPFLNYLNNLPAWDSQTDYIQELASTVKTDNDQLWFTCFKRWFVAMIASLLHDNIINHTVIILSGNQGIGKTTWSLNLIPDCLKAYTYSGSINPGNKDTLIHLSECVLINLDELENLNRTEIGSLKEIITKSAIRTRKAYGRNNENTVRRATFIGSVNNPQFLNDITGSRRFLPFESLDIQQNFHINYDQLYAQAIFLFNDGFRYWFEKSDLEIINANNDQFQIKTIEEESLLTWFRKPEDGDITNYFTATQILNKIADNNKMQITNANVITLGKLLKKHDFKRLKKNNIYVYAISVINPNEVDIEKEKAPSLPNSNNLTFDVEDQEDTMPF